MKPITMIKLHCPRCLSPVRGVEMMLHATAVVDRTCRHGHAWRVVIRPLDHDDVKSTHKAEWSSVPLNTTKFARRRK